MNLPLYPDPKLAGTLNSSGDLPFSLGVLRDIREASERPLVQGSGFQVSGFLRSPVVPFLPFFWFKVPFIKKPTPKKGAP